MLQFLVEKCVNYVENKLDYEDALQQLTKLIKMLSECTEQQSGFIHFFRAKVQGLFKELPGPFMYFEISRAFLSLELPPTEQNICV